MTPELKDLLERARDTEMTEGERDTQRMSFAFGNTNLEDDRITRETVRRASRELNSGSAASERP